MVTQSKVNDKRFWALWKGSGAVGDALKAQARDVRRQLRGIYRSTGNLTRGEANALIGYLSQDSLSVDGQVEKYYLRLKYHDPEKAVQMRAETAPLLMKSIDDLPGMKQLCNVLSAFLPLFSINIQGNNYTEEFGRRESKCFGAFF